jgi:hypothetical protein
MVFRALGELRGLSPPRSGSHVNGLPDGIVDEFSSLFFLLFDVLLLFRGGESVEVEAGD